MVVVLVVFVVGCLHLCFPSSWLVVFVVVVFVKTSLLPNVCK